MRVLGIAMADCRMATARRSSSSTRPASSAKRRLDRAMVAAAWRARGRRRGGADGRCRARHRPGDARHRRAAEDRARRRVPGPQQDRPGAARDAAGADRELNALAAFEQIFMVCALQERRRRRCAGGAGGARCRKGRGSIPRTSRPTCRCACWRPRSRASSLPAAASGTALRAAVETEKWEERRDGCVRIEQIIYVQRDGQRAIVLGKGGARIKQIGARARQELSQMLERPVHLFLHVKVSERWAEDPSTTARSASTTTRRARLLPDMRASSRYCHRCSVSEGSRRTVSSVFGRSARPLRLRPRDAADV